MGWLFACFGYTKTRKRPRKASRFCSKSRRIRSYQALESESNDPHSHEDTNLEFRAETKDENKGRIRKKVRFNLDVIAYEPIATDDASTKSQEDKIDKNRQEIEDVKDERLEVGLVYASLVNHRYSNCYEQDDDEDDDDEECELSDFDDEDDDGEYYDNDEWVVNPRIIYHEEIAVEHQKHCSEDEDLGISDVSTKNTRFRSHYVVPVLNPIENLSQWKALKGRK